MRSYAAKKIGQSDYELVLSAFLSFFLHAAIIVLALILYSASAPKVYIPPFYDVKLVGPPAEAAPAPAAASALPVTKAEPAPIVKKNLQPKVKIAAPKPVIKASKKDAMPELAHQKPQPVQQQESTPATAEQARPAPKETASAPSVHPAVPVVSDAKTAGVGTVKPASGDSKQLTAYSQKIHDNIERNWNPPPGVKGMKVKVKFRVLRSGRVFGDVNIEEPSGNAYFDMAAKRAILSSSPFPPMPDEFYKQYEEFSVHLAEKE